MSQPDLCVAALLHDVGKVSPARFWRAAWPLVTRPLVVLEAIAPRWLDQSASADPQQRWRYALYVQREHPQIGAGWAGQVGCTPDACWLIAHHQILWIKLARIRRAIHAAYCCWHYRQLMDATRF